MLKTGVRRLVNTGTSWQNFGARGDEPVCLYAATKSAFEEILRYYVAAENFKVLNLRIYDTFGPDDQRPKLIPKLLKCFETQQALELSPGEQKLDFVHIDDVVNGFVRAGELLDSDKSEAGYLRSYSLSSGDLVSLRELISIIEGAKGQKLNVKWGARPYRKREVMMPFEGLERLPGWAATRKLEESLRELIRAAE
jgi:nucleoside-diphosphate-sugar epimerase